MTATKKAPPRVAPASKQAIDAPRRSTFMLDPFAISLVGRGGMESKYTGPNDTSDGEEHPLFDPRALEEPDDELAESLGQHGQIQPIVVRKNGERFESAAGRRRVLAARLWNLVHPEDKIELECKLSRGKSETELLELVIAENEHRREVPIVSKARMAQRLLDRGRSEDYVATLYRVSTATLRTWLPTLDMAPQIQDAMESGELSKYEADKVADLSHKDQAAALELSRETGSKLSDVAGPAKPPTTTRRRGSSAEPSTRPSIAEIRHAIESKAYAGLEITWREALSWVLGDRSHLANAET